jgi:cobalamin-dependent methionine synthase I
MNNKEFHFDFNDLKISVSQIEDVIGYKEGEDRELVTELIEEILKELHGLSNIKAQYKIFPVTKFDNDKKLVEINNITFNIKKIVFQQIKKSDSVAVFLCTAGEDIGIMSRKAMQSKDLLKGYIYDVIGSEIVEAATDLMQDELEKSVVSTGKKITNRYSPGYCGWDVAEQFKLFQLLPENYCGIRLTESALMDPVKSISGIIGIGKNVRYNPYTCRFCEMKDCIYRKLREKSAI